MKYRGSETEELPSEPAIADMSAISNTLCPVCRTAEVISGKWTLLVIRDLAEGDRRFCELERSLGGISPRTLSLRLRALEERGIVQRITYPQVPPRVEYGLTEMGRALVPLIEDMRSYGKRWLPVEGDDDCGYGESGPSEELEAETAGSPAASGAGATSEQVAA